MSYAVVIKSNNEFYLYCGREGHIVGFPTKEEALANFEDMYDEFHKRSYESSMSAAIHWMSYQPSIIELAEKDIPTLFTEEELKSGTKMVRLQNLAGSLHGAKLTKESSLKLWDSGTKPKLIKDI